MLNFLRYISVTILSLLVLLSTTSMSVDMHYCGDNLVDYSFFSKAKSCGMNTQGTPSKSCKNTKKKCCDDLQINIDPQEDIQAIHLDLNTQQQLFFTAFVYTYFKLILKEEKETFNLKNYAPPLLISDIQVLDQTFLI